MVVATRFELATPTMSMRIAAKKANEKESLADFIKRIDKRNGDLSD